MNDITDKTKSANKGTPSRDFRLPDLAAAATQFQASQSGAMRGPIGCLFWLAGIALIFTFFFFLNARVGVVLSVGLACLVIGIILWLPGIRMLGAWLAAIGLGTSMAAVLSLIGATAPWIYWIFTGVLVLGGIVVAKSGSFVSSIRRQPNTGCRIGFFRPFRAEYSTLAKNLLVPLLSGYGSVFHVTDDTFEEAEFKSIWSKDYEKIPFLIGGYKYTNKEWQRKVIEQIATVDVAIIDVSACSTNVVWEIKQCYDRLPSHRIVKVLCGEALSYDGPITFENALLTKAINEHITPIFEGLDALDANPTTQPLLLVYTQRMEGQLQLANALYQAMSNIVAIETSSMPPG